MINFLTVTCLTLSAITLTFGTPYLYAATTKIESKAISTFGMSRLKDAKIGTLKHKGMLSLEDSSVGSIETYGPAKLEKVNVKKGITVFGPLKAKECDLGKVEVTGPCQLDNSKTDSLKVTGPLKVDETEVSGAVSITGPMRADEATFKKSLEITGPLRADESKFQDITITVNTDDKSSHKKKSRRNRPVAVFDESTAGTITVKGKAEDGKPQVIVLIDGTKIKKIIFESKKGLVVADSDSAAEEIVGGELKDKAKKQARKNSRKKKERKSKKNKKSDS